QIPLKGDYSRLDMQRTARLQGIPFNMPEPFPIATVAAARIMLVLGQEDAALAKTYAQRAMHAYYVDNVDIGQTASALHVAAGLGIDRDALSEAISSDGVKALLRHAYDEALARGAIGFPFVILYGVLFGGFDRI